MIQRCLLKCHPGWVFYLSKDDPGLVKYQRLPHQYFLSNHTCLVFFQWSMIKFWSKHFLCWDEQGSDESESSCSRDLHFLDPVAVNPLPELYSYFSNEQDDSDNGFETVYVSGCLRSRYVHSTLLNVLYILSGYNQYQVYVLHVCMQACTQQGIVFGTLCLRLQVHVIYCVTHTVKYIHWHFHTLRKNWSTERIKHMTVSVTALKNSALYWKSSMWSEGGTKRGTFHLKQEHSCFWEFSWGRNVLQPNMKVW